MQIDNNSNVAAESGYVQGLYGNSLCSLLTDLAKLNLAMLYILGSFLTVSGSEYISLFTTLQILGNEVKDEVASLEGQFISTAKYKELSKKIIRLMKRLREIIERIGLERVEKKKQKERQVLNAKADEIALMLRQLNTLIDHALAFSPAAAAAV